MFGSAIHAALESYYAPDWGTRDPRRANDALTTYLTRWYASLVNPDIEDDELYRSSLLLGIGMLDHYFRAQSPQDDFEVVWVEKEYTVPIPGVKDALYSFKPDGLVRDKEGRLWMLEHKTADKLPNNTEYLLMDSQVGGYLWGLSTVGLKIEGCRYNILRKKLPTPMATLKNGDLSQRADADTTYEAARSQIETVYGFVPQMYEAWLTKLHSKGNRFFYRENVRRNPTEIEIQGNMIAAQAREMLSDPYIYRNPNKSNCGYCAFVGPCLARHGGDDYEAMLVGNYTKDKR